MELHRAAMDRVVRSAARKIQAWKIEESVSGEERRGDRALNAFQLEREREMRERMNSCRRLAITLRRLHCHTSCLLLALIRRVGVGASFRVANGGNG
jgi:hypothetical protein